MVHSVSFSHNFIVTELELLHTKKKSMKPQNDMLVLASKSIVVLSIRMLKMHLGLSLLDCVLPPFVSFISVYIVAGGKHLVAEENMKKEFKVFLLHIFFPSLLLFLLHLIILKCQCGLLCPAAT